jgi:putative inorganic carbon (hco3(-)) transporter
MQPLITDALVTLSIPKVLFIQVLMIILDKKALLNYAIGLLCTFVFVSVTYLFENNNNILLLSAIGIFIVLFFLFNRVLLVAFFISLSFFDFTLQGLTFFKLLGYLLLGILFVHYLLKHIHIDLNNRLTILFIVIFLICCASQLVNRTFVPFYLNKMLMLFCMMLAINAFVQNIEELKTVILILAIAGFIAASITIYEVILDPNIKRVSGSLGNPNNTAAVFCMLLPFSMLIFRRNKKIQSLSIAFLFIIVMIVAIFLSASRGALFNLVFITMLAVLLFNWRAKLIAITVLLISILFFFNFFENYHGIERYQQVVTNSGLLESRAVKIRMEITAIGLMLFLENPILGIGSGNFKAETTNIETEYNGYLFAGIAPHNMYTQILAELGIIGFIFFGWFYFTVFEYLYSGIHHSDHEIKQMSMVLLFSFLSLLVSMMSSGSYLKPFLYIIAGFSLVLKRLAASKRQSISML